MTSELAVRRLVGRSTWWCVHPTRYAASSFNPNVGIESQEPSTGGRFHPFLSAAGRSVPTKYLADHPNGALAETVLREDGVDRRVELDDVRSRRLSQLVLTRDLRLADLSVLSPDSVHGEYLRRGPDSYPALRAFAAIVHGRAEALDGLLWQGYQLGQPGMTCAMLFGDRVSGEEDLEPIQSLELERDEGLARLEAAATLRGFALPSALRQG